MRVAFIGFGEAGQAFADGWARGGVHAFDIKTDAPETRAALLARMAGAGVTAHLSPGDALRGAAAVFCTVTADQAVVAAKAAAPVIAPGTLWFDCNSCAPDTKRAAARVIDAAGGRYVDVAVMAPVHPKRHLVPLLVSGPHGAAGIAVLQALGMQPRFVGDAVGRASSIKMLRSVMIKGMEALSAECFLAARKAGVEDEVIGSLEASDPQVDWRGRGAYNLERMMVHGARRAAEMREVAKTVADLGLPEAMASATTAWQQAIADLGAEPGPDDVLARADVILAALGQK